MQNRLSDNVGGVKNVFSTLRHSLRFERHFVLVEVCQANLGLASNPYGSSAQFDPCISSVCNGDHDYYSLRRGAGYPIITEPAFA